MQAQNTKNSVKKWPEYNEVEIQRRRKSRPPKKKNALYYFRRVCRNIYHYLKKLGRNKLDIKKIFVLPLVLLAVIASTYFIFFRKNSYEVMVGNKVICKVTSKEVTKEVLENQVKLRLKTEIGSEVQLKDPLTLKASHASAKELYDVDAAVNVLYKEVGYLAESVYISVDGASLAVLKNEAESDEVLNRVKAQYATSEGAQAKFVEEVSIEKKFIDESQIDDVNKAFEILSATAEQTIEYTVVENDTLDKIALKHSMDRQKLIEANPGMAESSILSIGQVLNVIISKPVLSVETSENIQRVEPVEFSVTEVPIESEGPNYRRVIREGANGEQRVTEKVTKLNGIETSIEEVSREIILAPVDELVEVGARVA